jgi:hypothetical protein
MQYTQMKIIIIIIIMNCKFPGQGRESFVLSAVATGSVGQTALYTPEAKHEWIKQEDFICILTG